MMVGVVNSEGQTNRMIKTDIDQTTDDLVVHTLQPQAQNSRDCDDPSIVHSSRLFRLSSMDNGVQHSLWSITRGCLLLR